MATAISIEKSISFEDDLNQQAIASGAEFPVFVIFTSMNYTMIDLFYLAAGCAFLAICWGFAKACDKL